MSLELDIVIDHYEDYYAGGPTVGDEGTDGEGGVFSDYNRGGGGGNTLDTHTLCIWSEWSPWGECRASSRSGFCSQWGTAKRSRSSSTNPIYCNVDSGLAEEQTTCMLQLGPECAKDCVVGQWTGWSPCSDSCGGGIQTRHRSIFEQAQFGGKACPGENDLSDTQACNSMPC